MLAVLGLLVGPGYWIYGSYVAGEKLSSFSVYGNKGWVSGKEVTFGTSTKTRVGTVHDSVTISQGRGGVWRWYTPVRLTLSPEMSPVLLRLKVDSERPFSSGEHGAVYEVTVAKDRPSLGVDVTAAKDRQLLVSETAEFEREREREEEEDGVISISLDFHASAQTVAVFDVPEAGDYVLNVEDVTARSRFSHRKLPVNHVAWARKRGQDYFSTEGPEAFLALLYGNCGWSSSAVTLLKSTQCLQSL